MEVYKERTVGDVVKEDYSSAVVFKRFGIDFCCGGGRSIETACAKAGVEYEELERALRAAAGSRNGEPDPTGWELDFLSDYIVNQHHSYVRENLPVLEQFTAKLARVHGERHPELKDIAALVTALSAEMEQHMFKEERILFPYIAVLVKAKKEGGNPGHPPFGTVRNPIRAMEHEHDHAGALMKQIRELSGDYVPPEDACTTYRVAYAKLEEFEQDLHRHVHLENNILFPGATEIEETTVA